MSQPADLPAGPPSPPAMDAAAIGQLVRDELDRNNKYLEFAQGQIEKDRSSFKYLYTLAFGFIAIIVAAAAFFSYSSVSQMRTDIKASVDAELERDKREIAGLTANGKDAITEAKTKTTQELENVRTEVQKRIDTEFKSDNIAALVASAAKERTNKELSDIIHSETAALVAKGIRDQSEDIQKTVENQTRESVRSLQPAIADIINSELRAQVSKAVEPVEAQMKTYQRLTRLSALARNDDRQSFDELIAIGNENPSEDIKSLAQATVLDIVRQKLNILHRMAVTFVQKPTPEEMKQILSRSKNRDERLAAIDNFPEDDKTILPLLVEAIRSDNDLEVVATAFRTFDARAKQSFQFPDYTSVLNWWNANHTAFDGSPR